MASVIILYRLTRRIKTLLRRFDGARYAGAARSGSGRCN